MKKRIYILAVIFVIVFSVSIFQIGCDMHSGYGIDVTSRKTAKTQILADNVLINSASKQEKQLGEILLIIPANSINDSYLNATRTSDSTADYPWSSYFEKVSDLYNITLNQSNSSRKIIAESPSELQFNSKNDYPSSVYYAAKKESENGNWLLLKPTSATLTNLSFLTYTFSDWMLIKSKTQNIKEKTPVITSDDILLTNGEGGNFKKDLEIKVCMPYSQSNKATLKLFSRGIFPLNYGSHIQSASSSYEINLLTQAQPEISSDLATYSIQIKMTDYTIEDMQKAENFVIAQAEYTDENQLSYISQKKISFAEDKQKGELTNATIVAYSPAQEEEISTDSSIVITFSDSMNTNSVESAISFTPEITNKINYTWSSENKNLSISAPFSDFQTYKLIIADTAKSIAGSSLQDNFVLVFNTPSKTDTDTYTTPPTIEATEPENYAEKIALNESATIIFTKEMDSASVEKSISITPTLTNGYSTSWVNAKTIIITSNNGWEPSTSYKLEIANTAKDNKNLSLKSNFILQFKTTGNPLIESFKPDNASTDKLLTQKISINFSKPMNTAQTEAAISVSPSATLSFAWSNDNKTVTISNSENWAENTYIRTVISNKAVDSQGIALLNPQSILFKTTLVPAVVIGSCSPTSNAVSVSENTTISVAFNKEVNHSSAESAFGLSNSTSSKISGTFAWNGNTLIFTPDSKLTSNTKYTVNVNNNYFDSNNTTPSSAVTWSFTTAIQEGSTYANIFEQDEENETFIPRTDHAMAVFNNQIWIIGGKSTTGTPLNDIHKSLDGKNWTKVTNGSFSPRFGHSCVVHNGKLWLTGGITINDTDGVCYLNDVWNSSDGKNWTKVADVAETTDYESETRFDKRAYHNMVSYKDKLWVMLGEKPDGNLLGDIWCSTDGITWTDRSSIVLPRKKASAVVFNDSSDSNYESIFVIGGYGSNSQGQNVPLNELLLFKDKATNWSKKSSSLSFSERYSMASTIYNNRIWLIGGQVSFGCTNEVLASNDGLTWTTLQTNSDFKGRKNHQAVTFNNQIFISGGESSNTTYNEVWSVK